jgi:hypothetical protein
MVPSWYRRAIKAAGAARCRGGRRRRADDDDGEERGGGRRREGAGLAAAHADLLRSYLPAYLLATAADWLQGPYKYALYSGYGYARRDIAHLFVAGYGSGMVLGGVAMSDCCLQGIEPCEWKGKRYQWVGNRVFRLGSIKELRKE